MVDHVQTRAGWLAVRRGLAIVTLALALTAALAVHAWAATSPVGLGTSGAFAVLAGSGMTNTGTSTIEGDVGSSPTHSQTGFGPCPAANCVVLTGTNHDVADPNDAVTQQAKSDLQIAYDDAFGRTGGTAVSAPLGSGQTLVAGVYTSAADLFVGGDLTLDGGGNADSVFIFQARTGTLITAAGTTSGIPNTRVLLTNGAQACNVFWQVGSSATIGTSTQFLGTIMAKQSITVNTNATLDAGRALALNGAVTLDTNVIKKAECAAPPADGTTTPPADSPSTTPTDSPTTPPGDGTTTPPATGTQEPTPSPTSDGGSAAAVGTARLFGPRKPKGPFRVSVTGTRIARVVYYLDGRRIAIVRARSGRTRFSVRIDPRRQSRRVHRITAVVRFTPKAGSTTTRLRLTYRRPVAPRLPRFTG